MYANTVPMYCVPCTYNAWASLDALRLVPHQHLRPCNNHANNGHVHNMWINCGYAVDNLWIGAPPCEGVGKKAAPALVDQGQKSGLDRGKRAISWMWGREARR